LTYSELRIPELADHPEEARALLAHFDLDGTPLLGFHEAMEQLCARCLGAHSMSGLRSALYTVAARTSRERPELLPAAALAAFSVRPPCPKRTLFTEMVLCATAIEWGLAVAPQESSHASLDVSTWLIAEPSRRLYAALGKERAHYYAAIPGVLPLLDPSRILFDVQPPAPISSPHAGPRPRTLADLANPGYTHRLRIEIQRVQGTLRKQYPAPSIADLEMLTQRALEALDDLPVQVNPLLEAIWIQSWVRHLHKSSRPEGTSFPLGTSPKVERGEENEY
jgi:hypothetical protein